MRSLWHYRRFVWDTAVLDVRYRYAGSALGVLWNVVTPLAMLALYTFIFSGLLTPRLNASSLAAAAFPLYLGSGFLPWAAFAECVTRGANAFLTNSAYLKKLPMPEYVFVAQAAVSATLTMLISLGLLIGLALVLGVTPKPTWLLLPVVVAIWQAFGFGLGLSLSTLSVFFRDLTQVLGVALQIWMWSVPVIYIEDILPLAYRATLPFNPAYPYLLSLRDLFLYAKLPDMWAVGAMLAWVVVSVGSGFVILRSLKRELRDLV